MKRFFFLSAALHLVVGIAPCLAAAETRLTSPKGAERWSVDSKHYISWEPARPAENFTVKIELTADGGKTWREIAAAAPDNGRYLWKIPNRVSTDCRVKVSSTKPGTSAESAASFSIILSQEVRDSEWVNATQKAAFAPRDGAGALVY